MRLVARSLARGAPPPALARGTPPPAQARGAPPLVLARGLHLQRWREGETGPCTGHTPLFWRPRIRWPFRRWPAHPWPPAACPLRCRHQQPSAASHRPSPQRHVSDLYSRRLRQGLQPAQEQQSLSRNLNKLAHVAHDEEAGALLLLGLVVQPTTEHWQGGSKRRRLDVLSSFAMPRVGFATGGTKVTSVPPMARVASFCRGFTLTLRPLRTAGSHQRPRVSATALATFLTLSLIASRTCSRATTKKHSALRPSNFTIPASPCRAAWASPLTESFAPGSVNSPSIALDVAAHPHPACAAEQRAPRDRHGSL